MWIASVPHAAWARRRLGPPGVGDRSGGERRSEAPVGRILVVDDDPTVVEVVARYLRREGHEVHAATDGAAALATADALRPDLVVLDLLLPGIDGWAVFRRLRDRSPVPVVVLTSQAGEHQRVAGLDLGADDYVTKPFSPGELAARVRAVLRRAGAPPPARDGLLVAGPVELDERARRVRVRGRPAELAHREFDLLAFFVRHPGEVFRREDLLERVWGYTIGDLSTVTVHVHHLRTKVELDPTSPTLVRTVWGVGYRFDPTEEPTPR